MSVRLRLALTVFLAGLAAALGVLVTVALAFQRFEHESSYQRADVFINRVVDLHADLLDQHERNADELQSFLRSLVLYDPGTQLYLLDASGRLLLGTSYKVLPAGLQVALGPVQEAARAAAAGDKRRAAYVMGDDPEAMGRDRVIAARPLMRARIGRTDATSGYLYLVSHRTALPGARLAMFGSSLAGPALAAVLAVIVLTTALAAWIIVAVTRPLQVLSDEVALAARQGFVAPPSGATGEVQQHDTPWAVQTLGSITADEFGRLRSGFHTLLTRLHMQWDELRRLDRFRRESVSNLSHDLRSPLTATVACLETLEQRWARPELAAGAMQTDRHLVQVALRNTRNAAGMVRALGDLALLDEPQFQLHLMRLNLAEVLDDITLRFAPRAAQQAVSLSFEALGDQAPVAEVDIELFERAIANVLDNALKFTPAGRSIAITVQTLATLPTQVQVRVQDQGPGIPAADLPQLFDRLYQSRTNVAPASSEEGRGLGLAIVKRIVELHRGSVTVHSELGAGTTVEITLPVV